MMHFNEESLRDLARLCKIDCDEQELKRLMKNLEAILDHVDQLNSVPTAGINPCRQIGDDLIAPLEADDERDIIETVDYMKNVPAKVGGMVKVPTILKS